MWGNGIRAGNGLLTVNAECTNATTETPETPLKMTSITSISRLAVQKDVNLRLPTHRKNGNIPQNVHRMLSVAYGESNWGLLARTPHHTLISPSKTSVIDAQNPFAKDREGSDFFAPSSTFRAHCQHAHHQLSIQILASTIVDISVQDQTLSKTRCRRVAKAL